MVFSSLVFLNMFLPIVLLLYFAVPAKARNFVLLLASLFFYAWGEPAYIAIMIFSSVFDYCNGRAIEFFDIKGKATGKKIVLCLSVVGNLAILGVFKYADFIIGNINSFTGAGLSLLNVALPIGISFYTFQTMSYTIDVYRGKAKAQHNILDFATYVCMFPQLIAGPIVRYTDVAAELSQRKILLSNVTSGIQRFVIGLGKKVIIANQMGALWEEISSSGALNTSVAWLGAICYTFQIYFDFSGYSDMAIGLGEILGFNYPENFDHPYESKSVTEFWRKWHMTLSSWFKEYVYIPLGGNRCGLLRQIVNLFIVWSLTGIWHGAGWNFLMWGVYYFILLVLEKFVWGGALEKLPDFFRHIYAMLLVIIGWVIFANESFDSVITYLKAMIGMGTANTMFLYYLRTHIVILLIAAVGSTTIPKRCFLFITGKLKRDETREVIKNVLTVLLYIICVAFLVGDTYNPFLYFRF
ncbi:MAG: MBOAT family protein [Eubacterium sp.]|nr:MBOAT family protein [Eubacterium sp.]